MRIECIAIGTELLTTRRLDTNSVWLGERLADMGLAFHRKTAVGDSREDLAALFREALTRSDLILTTGGLGPTFDDFTKELFAEILGAQLVEDAASRSDLLAFYAARNRVAPQVNFKQTLIPAGAEALRNLVGTAPGVWWQDPPGHPGVRIVMMPGVPREMKHLWEEQVEPRLRPLAGTSVHTLRMVVAGVPESALDERTQEVRERHAHLDWTILANLIQVELLARGQDPAALEAARRDFEPVLGTDLVCLGDGNLEDTVLHQLRARGETLAVAESMTGGLLASRLTAIPGASEAFLGGATAYTVAAKAALLGLDPAWLSLGWAPCRKPAPSPWPRPPASAWAPPGPWASVAMQVRARKGGHPWEPCSSPWPGLAAPTSGPRNWSATEPKCRRAARPWPWICSGGNWLVPRI